MPQTRNRPAWLDQLWQIHLSSFDVDWSEHLESLNAEYGLVGEHQFGLPAGLPPAWFVGDVEGLVPRQWVLVLSLNQARREEDDSWHLEQRYSPQSYWDHWRWLNRD